MMAVWMGLMALMLLFSREAAEAARQAAECFAQSVLPALLPMSVLGKMMPEPAKAEHSRTGLWFCTGMFAFAAGSPAAAQRVREGAAGLSAREREAMLCLCGVMSPLFFTGTLAQWLHSVPAGRKLLIIHWLGATLTALLWYGFSRPKESPSARTMVSARQPCALAQAVSQSAQAMLCVCGAMMVFASAASLAETLLKTLFPLWTAGRAKELALLKAFLEIGGGSSAVIRAFEKPHAALGALCGFGGLSVWLQNLLFLDKSVRPAKLLLMRAVHGAVSYGLIRIFRLF